MGNILEGNFHGASFVFFYCVCCVLKCVNNAARFVAKNISFLKNIKLNFIEFSSFLFEFLTTEDDWKFLFRQMFNNRKCFLDAVE